jgi:hypothetical protein
LGLATQDIRMESLILNVLNLCLWMRRNLQGVLKIIPYFEVLFWTSGVLRLHEANSNPVKPPSVPYIPCQFDTTIYWSCPPPASLRLSSWEPRYSSSFSLQWRNLTGLKPRLSNLVPPEEETPYVPGPWVSCWCLHLNWLK